MSNKSILSLSSNKTTWLVLFIIIISRIIHNIFFLDIMFDTTFQIIGTQELLSGNNISLPIVEPTNLSHVKHVAINGWPPGITIIYTPFYLIFGENYLAALLAMNCIASIAVIFISRSILLLLATNKAFVNAFTFISGFYLNYFYFIGSTDVVCLAFLLGHIAFVIKAHQNPIINLSIINKSSICLAAATSMKYLYFPISLALSFFLIFYGIKRNMSQIKKLGIHNLFASCIVIILIITYQITNSGEALFISSPGRGFFPEQLYRFYPFILGAVISINSISMLPNNIAEIVLIIARLLTVCVFILIIGSTLKSTLQPNKENKSPIPFFFTLVSIILITTVFVLTTLSLIIEKEKIHGESWWTYIEDARYFGLIEILLHMCIFLIAYMSFVKKQKLIRFSLILLPIFLLPEMGRGILFTANRIRNFEKETYYWKIELEFQNKLNSFISKKRKEAPEMQFIITGSKFYKNMYSTRHQQLPLLYDWPAITNPILINSEKRVLLIAIIGNHLLDKFKNFINNESVKLEATIDNYSIYTLEVIPH